MTNKVIICFFGVVSRSIQYTHKNLKEKLIDIVKRQYDVDVYVFNNNVENNIVDGIRQNNNVVGLLERTFFEEKLQSYMDKEIQHYIKSKNISCIMRNDYTESDIKNSIRQMYSENQVGLFLEKNINNYETAIVCGPDYYLLNPINLEDVTNSVTNSVVYTTAVNDGEGYTNGLYIGSLPPLIKILKRYSVLEKLLPTDKDYEYLLKRSFEMNKINRLVTNTLFLKIRSNKIVSFQGIMKKLFKVNKPNKINLFFSETIQRG